MLARKILLVQLYSNGDCLYATAVARQVKEDFPGCHLTWAIAGFCKGIIANNRYVDEVMEITSVAKDDVSAFRRFKKEIYKRKKEGEWDEVFMTQILDANLANYDGCIRSTIFRGYPFQVKVPVTPILLLSPGELKKVEQFAITHRLSTYKNVILFEFAPQSGQLPITFEMSLKIAEEIVRQPGTAIILSSANKINHMDASIIDGSGLSLRETAALTNYCTLLLGCSSGITWISTSEAAKPLPMVQLLNPFTTWVNPISRDFERFGLPTENLIELIEFDTAKVATCVEAALGDFKNARRLFHQDVPLHFRTSRDIVYNLLCYLNFTAIAKHIKVNREIYGNNPKFFKEVTMGFIVFPFRLTRNFFKKRAWARRR